MTLTDTPTDRVRPDETQVLFEEARQRRKRRWLRSGAAAVVIVLVAAVIGVFAARGGSQPTAQASPAAPAPGIAAASSGFGFSIRPVLCYAPPYSGVAGRSPSTVPLPGCSPASQLTRANLQVVPSSSTVNGYTSDTAIAADPQFAAYPSTTSSGSAPGGDVLLPGSSVGGQVPTRYVLGPEGIGRSAIVGARATSRGGQWLIDLTFTSQGSTQWDALAAQSFHEIVGVVINGRVVSAPLMQPTQSSYASFGGHIQISGGFSERQAKVLASELQ